MTGRRHRVPLTLGIATVIVGLLGYSAYRARQSIVGEIEARLTGAGLEWASREVGWVDARWSGLAAPGIQAAAVEVRLLPRIEVNVVDPVIDASQLRRAPAPAAGSTQGAAAASPPLASLVAVRTHGGAVLWEGEPVVEGFSGTLWPEVSLTAPQGALQVQGQTISGTLRRTLELDHVEGPVEAKVSCTPEQCTGTLTGTLALAHPLLAKGPLPATPVDARFSWDRASQAITASGDFGDVEGEISGSLDPDPLTWSLDLTVPEQPLEAFVALFGDHIPEARRAQVHGEVGATAHWSGPDGAWWIRPTASGLGAAYAIADVDSLKYGPFSWRAAGADDAVSLRRTGEGVRGWTALRDAGLVPHAMIAAEDSAFLRHRGYDLEAIQTALDEQAQGGGPLRGGSTLTQQLAKNLFLDGRERTLARKLRELLYALDLERTLPKPRILELYINIVELGPEIYGVGAAADAYFLKHPHRLTPREAAFIAAILPSPRRYHRRAVILGKLPNARIDRVIDNMADGGAIKPGVAASSKGAALHLVPPAR